MFSPNMLISNKKIPIYYGEKNYSPSLPSLPSPPPSPHESAIRWPLSIRDALAVSPKLNSIQCESKKSYFPPIKQYNRYRMRLSDAPIELLDYIEKSKPTDQTQTTPSHCLSRFSLSNAMSSPLDAGRAISSATFGSISIDHGKRDSAVNRLAVCRNRIARKNSYPYRAPSTDFPGITFKVDMYTPVLNDPMAMLRSNYEPSISSDLLSLTSEPRFSPSEDTIQESGEITVCRSFSKKQRAKQSHTKRMGTSASQRKRKGNSLARVMADRGLLESIFNTNITSNDIKLVRIPPPPPMPFDELISNINALELNTEALEKMDPEITWKGQPLSITHLPHYDALHPIEAHVVSILRLTPVQYLTGKYTLISASKRYVQRALPFKKSDAQKLLRIDVNKASKLWEFFRQVNWI